MDLTRETHQRTEYVHVETRTAVGEPALATLWRLHSDDVEIRIRPVPSERGVPMLELVVSHTALDVPSFTFTITRVEFEEMCINGLAIARPD